MKIYKKGRKKLRGQLVLSLYYRKEKSNFIYWYFKHYCWKW